MKLIRPIEITPAIVTANSATDTHSMYAGATTYAVDALVTHDRKTYKSLQSANTGHTPGVTDSAAWWSDQGPANSWAVFDNAVNTRTTAPSPWSFTLAGVSATGLGMMGIDASSVTFTAVKDGATVYTKTVDLFDTSLIGDWADYFFNEPEFRGELALTDLPPVPEMVITVTLTRNGGGEVSCGKFDCGRVLDVGLERYGLKRSGEDYTPVIFDEYRAVTIGTQRYVRKFSTTAILENARFDMIARRLDALASVPLVIIGSNGLFGSVIVYGLLSYSIDLAYSKISYVSLDVKGLI